MIYRNTILKALQHPLKKIEIDGLGNKYCGKVRDFYLVGDKRVLITTDRQSAFDYVLGYVPYKGAVLNMLSAWWFDKVRDIVDTHLMEVVDSNVMVVKDCDAIGVEMIVRGYLSGVTKTSIWKAYEKGEREIYGLSFPDGMKKNQKLPRPIITPTSHAQKGEHDEKLTKKEIVAEGLVSEEVYEEMEKIALKLFERGSEMCKERGLILVDTKYEFGLKDGELVLIDEIHTPDCSRFWKADTYQDLVRKGEEPEHFDKEFLRLYYKNELNYDGVSTPMDLPDDLAVELAKRYVACFEKITGQVFEGFVYPIDEKVRSAVKKWHRENYGQGVDDQKDKEKLKAGQGPKKVGSYKEAGVDVEVGDEVSGKAAVMAEETFREEVEKFGGVVGFRADFADYDDPYLVGATDGVGTKVKIAFMLDKHDSVGIDLVAMCVNDLVRRGVEPLTFLPYLALNKMDPAVVSEIMYGVVRGCKEANCAIVGGESAEMSDMYKQGEYDLAGMAVGVVERNGIIDGSKIKEGDVIIGLESNGLHSNGYTLVRKVLLSEMMLEDKPRGLGGRSLGEELLRPTRIYVREVLEILDDGIDINGLAHITGGGLSGKLGGVIPAGLRARIDRSAWEVPAIFKMISEVGSIAEEEMLGTFNMGIGMIIMVNKKDVQQVLDRCDDGVVIGEVVASANRVEYV